MDEVKYCGGCNRDKSVDDFHKSARRKNGLSTQCKECACENGKRWYAKNKEQRARVGATYYSKNRERVTSRVLQRKYGITIEEYHALAKAQGYVCAICGEPEGRIEKRTGIPYALAVDHCHETKVVRGLLCRACNYTLGYFGDSLEGAKMLVDYLEKSYVC